MNEKAIAAALEPVIDQVVALERRIDAVQLAPGPKGDAGRDADALQVARALAADPEFAARSRGADGRDGSDGAGIAAPPWIAGEVYRAGTVVVAFIGQHFVALKDTAAAPGDSAHWKRIGGAGFRHRGSFDKDATYTEGDLYVDGFATFCVVNGAPVLLAGRGAKGERGERGEQGARAKDGRDGATIIGAQVTGFKLVLVQQNGDGSLDHIEADFGPAFKVALDEALRVAMA